MRRPSLRPHSPFFSSGPCKKFPGWHLNLLHSAALGRSHRHSLGARKLKAAIDQTHALLEMPQTHKLAIVSGSSTGAIEIALWNFLGSRGVDCFSFDVFGQRWAEDLLKHLRLKEVRLISAPFGELPDLFLASQKKDIVFTWNGTTSGVCIPHADWIAADRQGLTICDATSAAFAYDLPWEKLDIVAFSWQKVLGGEAAHGMLALSPRALAHLETYKPHWPIPYLYQLTHEDQETQGIHRIKEKIFEGETLNTPSLLCVEDWLLALEWARSLGGLQGLLKKTTENAQVLFNWVETCSWLELLSCTPEAQSKTSVCLKLKSACLEKASPQEKWSFIQRLCSLLEEEGVAYDIKGHGAAPPCLRIWCGPTIETEDLRRLLPWLEWGYQALVQKI